MSRFTFRYHSWEASIHEWVYSNPLTAHCPFKMRPVFVLYPTLSFNTIVFYCFPLSFQQRAIRHPEVNGTPTEWFEILLLSPSTGILNPSSPFLFAFQHEVETAVIKHNMIQLWRGGELVTLEFPRTLVHRAKNRRWPSLKQREQFLPPTKLTWTQDGYKL